MRSDVGRLAAGGYRVLRAVGYRVRRRMVTTVVSAAPDRPAVRRLIPATLQQLADSGPDLAVSTHRARYVVERRQADVTVWQLAARTSDAVTEVLERAGVAFFATHLPLTRVAHWAVPRDQLAQAVRAISRELGPEAFYVQLDQHTARPRLAQEGLTPEELASVERLTVFQHVRCTTTGELHGAPDGCQIAVWDRSPERATLVAPDRGMVQEVDDVTPLHLTVRQRWDGAREPVPAGATGDARAIDFPIDAVYLWVDDSDPAWRARRDAARRELAGPDAPGEESAGAHFFRDRGELRASMRSLEMYAPWIRHIYLVTDDQRPAWLDTEHGRVTLVDHRDIFADPAALPTFSSHAIGTQLHRIPGLAEHYLVMNDDVMFTHPVSPYDFFTPAGQLNVFFSRARRPDISRDRQNPLEQARTNSAELIERDFGRRASSLFAHVPIPQRKDVAEDVAERYAEEFERTARGRFRSATDVEPNSWLHLYTALFTGRGVPGSIRYGYFNIGRAEVRRRLDNHEYSSSLRAICLNDVPPPDGEEEADPEWLAGWLERRFPVPAPFELSAGGGARPSGGGRP